MRSHTSTRHFKGHLNSVTSLPRRPPSRLSDAEKTHGETCQEHAVKTLKGRMEGWRRWRPEAMQVRLSDVDGCRGGEEPEWGEWP